MNKIIGTLIVITLLALAVNSCLLTYLVATPLISGEKEATIGNMIKVMKSHSLRLKSLEVGHASKNKKRK